MKEPLKMVILDSNSSLVHYKSAKKYRKTICGQKIPYPIKPVTEEMARQYDLEANCKSCLFIVANPRHGRFWKRK